MLCGAFRVRELNLAYGTIVDRVKVEYRVEQIETNLKLTTEIRNKSF